MNRPSNGFAVRRVRRYKSSICNRLVALCAPCVSSTCRQQAFVLRPCPRRAFYWGYYVHLLTDALWIELGMRAFIGRGGEWNRDLRRRMKRDALAWEQGFYRAHPDYPPLQKLEGVQRLGFDPMGLPEALILSRLQGVRPAYEGERAEAQIIAPEEYERALDRMIHLARMVIRGK